MLIDFHTHCFPDKLAEGAIARLQQAGGYPSHTDGTAADTVSKLSAWGVDAGVVLHIAVSPRTQRNVNDFAIAINDRQRIFSFGSVHPDAPDALDELARLKDAGIRGIKLHPAYQNFAIDDPGAYPIYQRCGELGLPILFHAGWDVAYPDVHLCDPDQCANVLADFPDSTFILAHLGGMRRWDDVERFLLGKNVYLDTAFVEMYIEDQQARRILTNHDPRRLLFGSDCPWSNARNMSAFLDRLGITGSLREHINYRNAAALLGISLED